MKTLTRINICPQKERIDRRGLDDGHIVRQLGSGTSQSGHVGTRHAHAQVHTRHAQRTATVKERIGEEMMAGRVKNRTSDAHCFEREAEYFGVLAAEP